MPQPSDLVERIKVLLLELSVSSEQYFSVSVSFSLQNLYRFSQEKKGLSTYSDLVHIYHLRPSS